MSQVSLASKNWAGCLATTPFLEAIRHVQKLLPIPAQHMRAAILEEVKVASGRTQQSKAELFKIVRYHAIYQNPIAILDRKQKDNSLN